MTLPGTYPSPSRDPWPLSARFCPNCAGCFRDTRVEIDGNSARRRVCDSCGTTSTVNPRQEVGK
jgi:hypothetical protein